jgi:hypothetical protein
MSGIDNLDLGSTPRSATCGDFRNSTAAIYCDEEPRALGANVILCCRQRIGQLPH